MLLNYALALFYLIMLQPGPENVLNSLTPTFYANFLTLRRKCMIIQHFLENPAGMLIRKFEMSTNPVLLLKSSPKTEQSLKE